MRFSTLPQALVITLLAALLAACNGQQTQGANGPNDNQPQPAATEVDRDRVDLLDDLPAMVDQALPAVVGISTVVEADPRSPHPFFEDTPSPFGPPDQGEGGLQRGIGSGVIVSTDGYILTNHHVVDDADDIRVRLHPRGEYSASVVGTDPRTDLAVIELDEPPEDLQTLDFVDPDNVRLGEPVVAIGNPFGLASTVTQGIVSALGRQEIGIIDLEDFVQTDAAINPGNSGGPLLNMRGEVVGINTAILAASGGGMQGIGFAIPAHIARTVMQSLIEDGEVVRGWLGVAIQTLSSDLAGSLDLPPDTRGVLIADVQDDSPADEAGLRRGDIIISLEGEAVEEAGELRNRIALTAPDTTVELGVLRDGERGTFEVDLGTFPEQPSAERAPSDQDHVPGLELSELTSELRSELGLPPQLEGLVVRDVAPTSAAARLGLRPGDVVIELNRNPVSSLEEFARLYQRAEDRLLFLIFRDDNTMFLAAPKP
jgi:serine protease Do